MNKKWNSLLAIALSAMMLLSACGEKEKDNDDDSGKKGNKNDTASSVNVDFEFKGINSALSYIENAVEQIDDVMEGKVDTGVTTEISATLSDSFESEMGIDIKEIKLSNSAKVKGGIAANDMTLLYGGNSLISLNTVIDDNTVYFRVPELSDSYLKVNTEEFDINNLLYSDVNQNQVNPVYMIANPSAGLAGSAGAFATALESMDEEKLSKIFDEIVKIAEKNMPEGKKGDSVSGDINGVKYDYTSKIFTISGKNTYDALMDILEYAMDDKDIAKLYDSLMEDTKQEMLDSGYYTEDEISDLYPKFEQMIADVITSLEASKEDAYATEEIAKFTVYYDGDEAVGILLDSESDKLEIVLIDEADKLGFKFATDDKAWDSSSEMAFSMVGTDGKYDAKLVITEDDVDDEFDSYVELGFTSDVEIVDEKSGAFKGEIEFYAKDDSNEEAKIILTSDSTAKETDMTFDFIIDNESLFTVGFTNVETNASDVTIPSGKVYDMNNADDFEAYSNTVDIEGLESHFRTVLGDDLFAMMFESEDYDDDDYYYDEDYDYDYDDDYWY